MDGETWRYEIRGSSLYDLTEARGISLAEAGELLNTHQHLLITSGVWAGKAGLAEAQLAAARADAEAGWSAVEREVRAWCEDTNSPWEWRESLEAETEAALLNHENLKAGHSKEAQP